MAIDPNIILAGQQQPNTLSTAANGIQFGQGMRQLLALRQIGNMQQLDDANDRKQFANNSMFSRELNNQLKVDDASKQKQMYEQLKAKADIANTTAQSKERLANADKTNQDAGSKRYNLGLDIWKAAHDDPGYAKVILNNQLNSGAIDQLTYDGYMRQMSVLDGQPQDEVRKIAGSQIMSMLDPKYQYADANTVANNETSRANNTATVEATMRGQDITAETANKDRAQKQNQFTEEQKLQDWLAKNKPIDQFTAADGTRYNVFPGGKGIPVSDAQGVPIKVQKDSKPKLSDNAIKQINESNLQLSQAKQNYVKIGNLVEDLQSGNLDLSPSSQLSGKAMNMIGMSTPNSRNIENFQTTLNQAVNDILMMAKGTQTEGDAQRAAQIIAAFPPRDKASAMRVLNRLAGIQRNIIETLDQNIDGVYSNYGEQRPERKVSTPAKTQNNAYSANLNDIKSAAQKAGISIEEMTQILQSQGVSIR